MDAQKSTSRYILTALAIILVITAFILVALNALKIDTPLNTIVNVQPTDDAYREGFLAARDKYTAMCPMINLDGNTIYGTVTSITNDGFVIEQNTFDTEESIDGIGNTRAISASADTKVEIAITKDQETFQKELAEFKPSPDEVVTPPAPVTMQTAVLSEVKIGDTVRVVSDKILRLESEILATEISITRNP